ncbi:hypothetical protein [Bernardetia sp.]|uniref:hypothetical protein n=1 Tax=Bernardetia sp. TaxID=1937974 RepID=UPI0025BF052A|nr:hypothetical protein [Bernardetia sp.]
MPNEVVISENFKREAKKFLKKYASLKSELAELAQELKDNPKLGTQILENAYKIRLACKSKGKGKSGGFRIITYLEEIEEDEVDILITLLSIYDKSETDTISNSQIKAIIESLDDEK